jgi:hypothetical protein
MTEPSFSECPTEILMERHKDRTDKLLRDLADAGPEHSLDAKEVIVMFLELHDLVENLHGRLAKHERTGSVLGAFSPIL